ncbi:MAG: helix-turn-helix domain-containing protein [Actinobacteria bacterium]|nr:helix-turn-helix domain-containing protein [Actinomycetota bacterium]
MRSGRRPEGATGAKTGPDAGRHELLTTEEAADYLTVTAAVLRRWRLLGDGPPYVKLGSLVRYDRAKLDRWIDGQEVAV